MIHVSQLAGEMSIEPRCDRCGSNIRVLGAVGEVRTESPASPQHHRVRKNKGKWTHEEQLAFLRGVHLYGRNWEAVASLVVTRTVLQIRTHSQKYFKKIDQGRVFPEDPYPSQYDIAAGKSGAFYGAFLYDLPQHGEQQAMPVGGDSGNFGGEVEPCLPHPSPPVCGEQRAVAEAAGHTETAGGAGASFVVHTAVGASPSGSAVGFGIAPRRYDSAGAAPGLWLGRSSGAPYPGKHGSARSSLDNNSSNGTDIRRPQHNRVRIRVRVSSPAAFSASSAPSSSSSFPSAAPSSTTGYFQQSNNGWAERGGGSSHPQSLAGSTPSFSHGATGGASYLQQGGGGFGSSGMSGGHHQQQQQCDLVIPFVFDDPPMGNDGDQWLDASQDQDLPFYDWLEGGGGVDNDIGDF